MIEGGQKASFENDDEEECFGGRRRRRGRHLSWLRGALFGKRLQTNDEGQRRGVRRRLRATVAAILSAITGHQKSSKLHNCIDHD